MNTLTGVLIAIGALATLAAIGGSTWAIVRTAAQDTSIKRLNSENEGYVRRLNYVEPKLEVLERENQTLRDLHNPAEAITELAAQLADLAIQEAGNHKATFDAIAQRSAEVLLELRSIDVHLQEGWQSP